MGDHILPQVLLRGFAINPNDDKAKMKIRILTPDGDKTKKIKDEYQQLNFYPADIEKLLDREFENPFGALKLKMIKELIEEEKNILNLSKEEMVMLIRFFTVMWRRNDEQLIKTTNYTRNMLNNPNIRRFLRPEHIALSTEKLIEMRSENLKHILYKSLIEKTTEKDPTVQKHLNDYYSVILINKTDISFPLHNKYSSVQYPYPIEDEEYPDFIFEPITNKIMVFSVLLKNHGLVKENMEIPAISIKTKEEIVLIINMYLLNSIKSVVVDDSNIDLVINRLKYPDRNLIKSGNPHLIEILKRISDALH